MDRNRLDDFVAGDWIGVHYQEPCRPFYDFPTIIDRISNRNEDSQKDYVLVKMAPIVCPAKLQREYILRIWHLIEATSCSKK